MAGLYFEQFEVGQTFKHDIRRTVTETDNVLFSTMTHNPAAIHLDAEYAKDTEFGKPVFAGDTLHVETEVLEKRESQSRPANGIVVFQHTAWNQRNEVVATLQACGADAACARR